MTVVIAILLAGLPADSSIMTLEEVVVTAERIRHPVRDVAASVSVVTAEEIKVLNARTATDALAALPGTFVQQTGQFGRTDIDIRGIGDRGCRIAVLIDGRPEKMPLFGCTVTHTLPVNNIDRIEVVRGPLSVLYGSDAIGGVINIVTRRAESPVDLSGQLDYGSFNTLHGRITAGTQQSGWHALFSFDKAKSDGHLPNSQYNGNDVSLRTGASLLPFLDIDFTGKFFTGVKHEPNRATDPETLVASGWNRYDRGGLDLTASLARSQSGGFVKLYRTFGEHVFDPKDGWHSTDFTNGAIVHGHYQFEFGNLLQAGIEAKQLAGTWIKSDTSSPSWSRSQLGVFGQTEQRIGFIVANTGLRYEHDAISGGILVPKCGLVLHPFSGLTLRASLNRGFRFAPFNYTSIYPPKNPELEPELSWNYEAGINWQITSGIAADMAGYILTGENLIELGTNPNPPPPRQFQNKGSFRFKGIELGTSLRHQCLQLRAGATIADYGINTRARPGLKLNADAGIKTEKISMNLGTQTVARYYAADSSKSPIPSYTILDLRAGYRVLPLLQVRLAIENLLNCYYVTFVDLPGSAAGLYQQPGRSFTIGLDLDR
ncbi:MAG: TonB-dependent receptor [candidate division WOR-3 bacterium]